MVGPEYKSNNYDKAYEEYGNYITINNELRTKNLERNQEKDSSTKKSALADLVRLASLLNDWFLNLAYKVPRLIGFVKSRNRGVDLPGVAPGRLGLRNQSSKRAKPTPELAYQESREPVNWNNYDKAYEEYGNYITQNQKSKIPSTSLRTGKNQNHSLKLKSLKTKTENEDLFLGTGGFFVEGDVHQKNNYQKQGISDTYFNINVSPISHSDFSSNLTANTKERIPIIRLNVKSRISFKSLITNTLGRIITEPIQPADRLVKNPDKILNQDLDRGFFIKPIYADDNTDANQLSINNETVKPFDSTQGKQSNNVIYYPFRSLFTGRRQEELEFEVKDYADYFSFKSQIPTDFVGGELVVPALEEQEVTEIDEDDFFYITEKLPQIFLDGKLVEYFDSGVFLELPYIREGNLEIRVPKIRGYYSYNLPFDSTQDKQPKNCDKFNQGVYTHERVSADGKDLLRLTSIGSSNCLDFDLPRLSQRLSYLVSVESRNIEGKSLIFSVINKNSQRADLETYLPKKPTTYNLQPTTSYFVIPPMEEFGRGYTLHFDNNSIGRVKTVNDLGRITVNPIPYRFLTSLKIVKGNLSDLQSSVSSPRLLSVNHSNPSFYQITTNNETMKQFNNLTLVLSQSFDPGWKAYEITNDWFLDGWYMKLLIPFFQPEIKDHVLVNNWENGWNINIKDQKSNIKDNKINIVIIYLPQYLEYFGFGLLGVSILYLLLTRQTKTS